MAEPDKGLKWGIERRLEFIEFRLFWDGHVNRSDLMDHFGVSINQASTDLSRYLALAPGNMAYDKSGRAYIRAAEFTPLFLKPDASRYLTQLRSVGDGVLEPSEAWLGVLPTCEILPTPARGVDAGILRSVVAAIRRSEALEVRYQSMSSLEPRWRWIAPHALAFDGFRWHARAFCFNDEGFKDFLLSRIVEVRDARTSGVEPDADADWSEQVTVAIGPHPRLTETQQKAIALDYGMRDGKTEFHVRKAMLYYALKRLGLDTDPSARRPQDQQIVLLNRDGISKMTKGISR